MVAASSRVRNPGHAALAAVGVLIAAAVAFQASSSADVTAVRGSAFGYSVPNFSIFGGPQAPVPPTPSVTLAPDASNSPQTASVATGLIRFGPAILFSSGPITVETHGSLGPNGSVTSSADIQSLNTSGQEAFTATRLQSSCTASESGTVGSTTVTNGRLQTSEGNPDVEGDEVFVDIPANPAPNFVVNGTIEAVGDTFQFVFNEQVTNPDGSLTVTALHQRLLGPTAVGDIYLGQVTCGVAAVPSTTTTEPTDTTAPSTTTTLPTTTTTGPTTTSTTVPTTTTTGPATSTTAPTTTTSSTAPTTTTTAPPTTTTTAPTTTTTGPTTTSTTGPTTTSTTVLSTTTTRATTTTTVRPGTTTTAPIGTTTTTPTPTTTSGPGPTARVSPSVVAAGQQVTVSGSGFPPNTPLDVLLFSDPVLLGTTTSDSAGAFHVAVTIPTNTTPGTHQIVVRGGGKEARVSITVTAPPRPAGPLPRTGSDARAAMRVGAVVLAAGLGLLSLAAMRPHRSRRPWR